MRADFDEADSDFLCARRIWSREQTKKRGECVIFVYRLVQI